MSLDVGFDMIDTVYESMNVHDCDLFNVHVLGIQFYAI